MLRQQQVYQLIKSLTRDAGDALIVQQKKKKGERKESSTYETIALANQATVSYSWKSPA